MPDDLTLPNSLTCTELCDIVRGLAHGTLNPADKDWNELTSKDCHEILTLLRYELDCIAWDAARKKQRPAQRRARKLLYTLLNPTQTAQLKRSRYFRVTGSGGGLYQLFPATGRTFAVVRFGSRNVCGTGYCLHDPENEMPPADVSIGHMLLLRCDEPEFLATANATPSYRASRQAERAA